MPTLKEPRRRVRMLDIAAAAGVSRATVSLVMRGDPIVATRTRDKVVGVAAELGYVYDRGAASLRTRRTNIVGLVVPDIANQFVAEISISIQETLSPFGYFLVLANTLDDAERQQLILRSLAEKRIDGLFLIPAVGTHARTLREIEKSGLAVVLLTRRVSDIELSFVGPDDAQMSRLAAEHLIGIHHCSTVAFFGGAELATARIDRDVGFRREAGKLGAQIADAWCVPSGTTARDAYLVASSLLASGPPPSGILCHSDGIAYGVLRALHDYRYRAGVDCRIIGIDNLAQSSVSTPSLSSIAVFPAALGQVSGRSLLQQMGQQFDVGLEPLTVPELIVRESCGCVPE